MPTYTFQNKRTKKRVDLQMSINEIVAFERENPHLERVYENLNYLDPAGMGVQRPPADFQKYVVGKVKAANPHGKALEKRWPIPKEI